jgi:hypothetical protein
MALELLEVLESTRDWKPIHGVRPDNWETRLVETINLLNNKAGYPSHRFEYLVREAMTTSDFPYLFGDIVYRSMLASYQTAPFVMRQICQIGKRSDFKLGNVFELYMAEGLLSEKAEKEEYKETSIGEGRYQYQLKEFGKKLNLSWRTLVNDDLGGFNRIPGWFADVSRASEEYFLTCKFFGASGPLAAYFSAGNGGAAVSNLPLTIGNLETAVTAMMKYTGKNTNPIDNSPMYLMTGPALAITAQKITESVMALVATGSSGIAYPTDNTVRKLNLKPLVNRWIPKVVTSGTIADTCWALFSDPNKIAAAEFGQYTGHENPDIYIKKSDLQRLGGGDASPLEGDFDSGNVGYLVRHCFGGCTLDGRAGWASNGQ